MNKVEYYNTFLLCNGFTEEQIGKMSEDDKDMSLGF